MSVSGPRAAVDAAPTVAGTLLPPWTQSLEAKVVAAVVIVVAGVYLSRYVVRFLGRPIARRFARESVAQTVLRAIRLSVIILALFAAAGLFGFGLENIVLSVTVFSAVLGIVLAPIVGSIINGVFVMADQPYEIGDMIEFEDGTRGFVDDIALRYTRVISLDNTSMVLPNGLIREQQVVNYSAEDERTRLSLPVLVTYGSDIDEARRLMEQAARSIDEVITGGPDIRIGTARYPAKPTAYIDEYADDGVLLTLRYWARKPYKLLTVRSAVQTELWRRLGDPDVDVEIAYPHRQVVFDGTDGPAQVGVGDAEPEAATGTGEATARPQDEPSDPAGTGADGGPSDRDDDAGGTS